MRRSQRRYMMLGSIAVISVVIGILWRFVEPYAIAGAGFSPAQYSRFEIITSLWDVALIVVSVVIGVRIGAVRHDSKNIRGTK